MKLHGCLKIICGILAVLMVAAFGTEAESGCNYICVENNTCHDTFSGAYTSAAPHHMDGVTVLAKAVLEPGGTPEALDVEWVPVKVIGGYNYYWDAIVGTTTFTSLNVSAGALTVENVVIQ